MASTLSSRKRIRQNQNQNARNRWRKRRIQTAVKTFEDLVVHHGSYADAEKAFREASAILDRIAGKKTIHRNRAARKKSRMARRLATIKQA